MVAIIPANYAPQVRSGPPSVSANRKRSSRLVRPVSCRSNIYRFRAIPAAMFNSRATNMPRCCAMSDLARSIEGAHDVRVRGLP
jgi:hypothetical protein